MLQVRNPITDRGTAANKAQQGKWGKEKANNQTVKENQENKRKRKIETKNLLFSISPVLENHK